MHHTHNSSLWLPQGVIYEEATIRAIDHMPIIEQNLLDLCDWTEKGIVLVT
jgi:hypothetical protein